MVVTLLLFAVLGFVLGRWLGLTRWGHMALAAISIGAAVTQLGLLFVTADRAWTTLLALLAVAADLSACVSRLTSSETDLAPCSARACDPPRRGWRP
jgi:hypothetical protein